MTPADSQLPPTRAAPAAPALTERAYDQLREAITSLVLQPGQQLTEASLAEWLGLGRTPVREALLRLRDEGLIEAMPRKGYTVTPISADEAQEIYEMLEGLEGMANKLAAERATPADLERMEAAIGRMEDALARQDSDAWIAADEEIHAIVLEVAHNSRIRRAVASLNTRIRRFQIFTIRMGRDRTESTRSHREQFEAIRAHDGEKARELREKLWQKTRGELVNIIRTFAGHGGGM